MRQVLSQSIVVLCQGKSIVEGNFTPTAPVSSYEFKIRQYE